MKLGNRWFNWYMNKICRFVCNRLGHQRIERWHDKDGQQHCECKLCGEEL